MPKCDGQEEDEAIPQVQECNEKCVPSLAANKACITKSGVKENFVPPPTVLDHFDCPACGADSDSEEDSDDYDEYGNFIGSGRHGRSRGRRDRRGRSGRRGRGGRRGHGGRSDIDEEDQGDIARRDAARYQPWTPYHISTVMLEKLAALAALFMYIYSDNYRWGLFKSFIFFTSSVKSMFSLAEVIKAECEKRQRCLDAKVFYSK